MVILTWAHLALVFPAPWRAGSTAKCLDDASSRRGTAPPKRTSDLDAPSLAFGTCQSPPDVNRVPIHRAASSA